MAHLHLFLLLVTHVVFAVANIHSHSYHLPLFMHSPNVTDGLLNDKVKSVGVRYNNKISLLTQLNVGTPAQKQWMVIDTASELTWLHCATSSSEPLSFKAQRSSTFRDVPCYSKNCNEDTASLPIPTTCDSIRKCRFVTGYADGTSLEGTLATDIFRFQISSHGKKQIAAVSAFMVFGCSASSLPGTPALLGFNRGHLSMATMFRKFSLCIPSNSLLAGRLVLGATPEPMAKYLHYIPLITMNIHLPYFDRSAYSVRLEGIKVGRMLLPIKKSLFMPDHTGAGQTMLDSATHFTLLLGEAYGVLKQEFIKQNRHLLGDPMNGNFVYEGVLDLCYYFRNPSLKFHKLSSVSLLFESSSELKIEGKYLLFEVPGKNKRVSCLSFGNSDLIGLEANVIGNHHQQDLWVEYDLANSRIGFARTRCSRFG